MSPQSKLLTNRIAIYSNQTMGVNLKIIEIEKFQIQFKALKNFLIYKSFPNMKAVRRISDHIPVWAELEFSPE